MAANPTEGLYPDRRWYPANDPAVALVIAGAVAAAEPDELHPAVIRAIEQWCRDAHRAC